MPKSAKPAKTGANEGATRIRKSLLSIGVDDESAEKLLSSRALERLVIPVYWKDGLVSHAHLLQLTKLPSFLGSFGREFPDGQARWDPDYEENNPQDSSSRVAVRVFFNYQEDDQGDHWSPRPTVIEDQSYQRMLKRYSYAGAGAVQASAAIYGE
ncbi:MAG TPA: hypothetical protein VGS04_07830 [Nitrososphaerales archaeon]|nr:hypothetical protein [Nitrososphaerales archaeon]